MAKKSSKRTTEQPAPEAGAKQSGRPAPIDQLAAVLKPPATAVTAKPPPTLPEPTQSPVKAAVGEKAPTLATRQSVKVTLFLLEPDARHVSVSGEFNGWSPNVTPMKRQGDGCWETTVSLAPGRYQYKFVVDGHWIPDPLAHENVWNQHGTLNSVVEVRA